VLASFVHFFTDATRRWFESAFAAPTEVQRLGWDRIAAGEHALLIAPTGSGKTLAAFLYAIDRLTRLPKDAEVNAHATRSSGAVEGHEE
jgi:ATP-dependent helicase Lhr and Lhr-like helicase